MNDLARRAFAHRADLLAALVYSCLAFLSFSALSEYANAHQLFPEPAGGWAFAVAIDGAVLYAFISFRRDPWLASLLLVSGATMSYLLQQWHASSDQHPAVVAGVIPAAVVLVTFAWHRIRSRPDPVVPTPLGKPAPEPAPADPAPDQDQPERTTARSNGSHFTADQRQRIADLVGRKVSAKAIQRELGMSDRAYRDHLLPLVRSLKGELVR